MPYAQRQHYPIEMPRRGECCRGNFLPQPCTQRRRGPCCAGQQPSSTSETYSRDQVSDVCASGYFTIQHPSCFAEGLFNSFPLRLTAPVLWLAISFARWLACESEFRWNWLAPKYMRVPVDSLRLKRARSRRTPGRARLRSHGVTVAGRSHAGRPMSAGRCRERRPRRCARLPAGPLSSASAAAVGARERRRSVSSHRCAGCTVVWCTRQHRSPGDSELACVAAGAAYGALHPRRNARTRGAQPPPPPSYQVDTPRPSPRTNRTRRVPHSLTAPSSWPHARRLVPHLTSCFARLAGAAEAGLARARYTRGRRSWTTWWQKWRRPEGWRARLARSPPVVSVGRIDICAYAQLICTCTHRAWRGP